MSELKEIARSSLWITILTMISRFLGMLRDILRAEYFGVSPLATAFIIAYKIPNILRNLVAEGSLSQAFIPIFVDYLHKGKDPAEGRLIAFRIANTIISVTLIILIGIVLLGEIIAPYIVALLSAQWQNSETAQLTTQLTRIMFPYIALVSIASLFMGILNTFKHFTAPALSPVVLNLVVIAAYFLLFPLTESSIMQVFFLSGAIVAGGLCQLLLQIYQARKFGFHFRFMPDFKHPAVRKIFTIMLPAVFGSGVYQLNQVIDLVLASYLEQFVSGAVASLEYAVRLMQLPLGIFGISVTTAMIPRLAVHVSKQDDKNVATTMNDGYSLIAFLTFPTIAGLIILAEPIIRLLLQRGAFDDYSTQITTLPLMLYAIGIFSYSCVKLTVAAFFSYKDSKTPVKIAAVILVINTILSLILMQYIDHAGLALSSSLGSFIHWGLLIYLLRRHITTLNLSRCIMPIAKTLVATLIMTIFVYLGYYQGLDLMRQAIGPHNMLWLDTIWVLPIIVIGAIVYLAAALFLRIESLQQIINIILKR